jgi:hypothetical protein
MLDQEKITTLLELTKMKCIRIIEAYPQFIEIYSMIVPQQGAISVFEYAPEFVEDVPENEWPQLDQGDIVLDGQAFITMDHERVLQFGSRMANNANCIHVYHGSPNLSKEFITFKHFNWHWAYHCYDDVDVEVFFNKDCNDAYERIKSKYKCREAVFPGLLGFDISKIL